MYKKIVSGLIIGAILAPSVALAQNTDVQAQAESIMAQIRTLQLQLKTLLASSTPMRVKMQDDLKIAPGQALKRFCASMKRDLRVGSKGEDVKQLQEYLRTSADAGFKGEATGFYGPLTANAVAKMQMRLGIASSTEGRFGPATRAFFVRQCGFGLQKPDKATTTPAVQ